MIAIKIRADALTELSSRAPAISFLSLDLTGECGLTRVYCYVDSGPKGSHGLMTADDWRGVIAEASAFLVAEAARPGLRVEVCTNLTGIRRSATTGSAPAGCQHAERKPASTPSGRVRMPSGTGSMGTGVKQLSRWFVATLVTVAAFSMATWACGILILLTLTRDPGVRWSISGGVGVAVSALAALWGHGFASQVREAASLGEDHPKDVNNEISGGVQDGHVLQARDVHGPVSFGTPGPQAER